MKLAIHDRPGSFSKLWIKYCQECNIEYKIVDCYKSDIVDQLKDCYALMYHHHHGDVRDVVFSKQLLFALQSSNIKVFPDFHTNWHFDDKIAQKYLFEALDIPTAKSHVYYDKQKAISWSESVDYPKVFKLRGGAGSANVKLARSQTQAKALINIAFGKGFKTFDGKAYLVEKWNKYKEGIIGFDGVIRAFGRMFLSTPFAKMFPREKGYAYFQDFIPNNDSDIRVIVIDNKAFAIKRMVREDDFRASGSGKILFDRSLFPDNIIKFSFDVAQKLKSNSCVLDIVFNEKNQPLVIEVSYCFSPEAYVNCEGYWDSNLKFYEGSFNPYGWMVDSVINSNK